MRRRGRRAHPSGRLLLRAVLRDRFAEESLLVLGRTPAAVDEDPDPVDGRIRRRLAQSTEESRIEPGDTRDLVIEDRRARGHDAVGLAGPRAVFTSGVRA